MMADDSRTCLVTGANSGIGHATARELARRGHTVWLLCRDDARAVMAQQAIIRTTGVPPEQLPTVACDLASLASVRRAAADIAARTDRLHVLINNAGVWLPRRDETADGIETMWAVNFVAPWLLTHQLLPLLQADPPARIVNVAGMYHKNVTLDPDDLQSTRDFRAGDAGARSKLALVTWTLDLAHRLAGSGITVNCLHPGAIRTAGTRHIPQPLKALVYLLLRPFFGSPASGAAPVVRLALDADVADVTGAYFHRFRRDEPNPRAADAGVQRALWSATAALAGVDAD